MSLDRSMVLFVVPNLALNAQRVISDVQENNVQEKFPRREGGAVGDAILHVPYACPRSVPKVTHVTSGLISSGRQAARLKTMRLDWHSAWRSMPLLHSSRSPQTATCARRWRKIPLGDLLIGQVLSKLRPLQSRRGKATSALVQRDPELVPDPLISSASEPHRGSPA